VIDRCACKRGFFTLRDCANGAVTSCSTCTRRVCADHLAQPGLCVECAAKQQEVAELDEAPTLTAVRLRRSWYDSRDYSPVWWATYDPYWSDSDYRWYDEGTGGYEDDDGGGFGDS
jgi:hypothetical protein